MAQKQNNYKRNGKRRNSRTGKPRYTDKDVETVEKPTNDPSWYSKYPQLVNDTASLFFSNPLGSFVPHVDALGTGNVVYGDNDYVPGIISLECIAVPGYSNSPNSPVNAVARGIYGYIRNYNSGAKNYESPDLMMYLLAMDCAYTFWAQCVRAYGVARLYNVRSRYLALQFLEAMGFDGVDILSNLAQFRATINSFAVKLGSFCVPSTMDFYRRHTDMYTKVYLDEPSAKAQSYIFKLWKYYAFNNTTQDGGKLILNDFPSAKLTLAQVNTVMDSIFNPIMADEDMNTMSGDILKAFKEKIFSVPMIDEGYQTPMVFDQIVLSQIENSMAVPTLEATSLGVTQDPTTSSIYFAPQVANAANAGLVCKKILNLHHDNPSPMDVMEATRLMYSLEQGATGVMVTNFGAELVSGYTIWTWTSSGLTHATTGNLVNLQAGANAATFMAQHSKIGNVATFNYHPRLTVWYKDSSNVEHLVMDLYQLDNYTVLDDSTLSMISNTAMLSLFDVEHVALATM